MNCWRCGQPVAEGATSCVTCGASTLRAMPTTDAGRAMRQLYDRYGADAVLTDSAYLGNGLGDLLEDSSLLRSRLRMAIEAGVGRLYLDQIRGKGVPDTTFGARVRTLLTGEVGLSDAAATEVSSLMDQMVGWRAELPKQEPATSGKKKSPAPQAPTGRPSTYGAGDEMPKEFQELFAEMPTKGVSPTQTSVQQKAGGCLTVLLAILWIVMALGFGGWGVFLIWCGVTGTVQSPAYIPFVLVFGAVLLLCGIGFLYGLKEMFKTPQRR